MTTIQLYFALLIVVIGINGLLTCVTIKYIELKINPIAKNIDILVQQGRTKK